MTREACINIGPCSIDGCERPSSRRTWCQMHYQRWLRWERASDGYVKRPLALGPEARTRRDDAGNPIAKLCTKCEKWQPIGCFYNRSDTSDGFSQDCSMCASERAAVNYAKADKDYVRERGNESRRRRRSRVLPGGNEAYLAWLTTSTRKYVPLPVVLAWIEPMLNAPDVNLTNLAADLGLTDRKLYELRTKAFQQVDVRVAEKVARGVGGHAEAEFEQLDPPHGLDGWGGKTGERYCTRCGTCWHPHAADGMCESCHRARWIERRDGRQVRTHRERMMDNLAEHGRHTIRPRSSRRRSG